MYTRKPFGRFAAIAATTGALGLLWPMCAVYSQTTALPAPPAAGVDAPANQAIEPLTSGPIHEAFATPTQYDVNKPLIVGQQPPDPIQETPPDMRPEGSNVIWIPGYWGWNDDQRTFIWISGTWRDAPPGQVWVSGYWTSVQSGFQWVPGFWTSEQNQELSYLPEPPANQAEEPSAPQPAENDFWVPGNWTYATNHYVWRPGFSAQSNPDWLWVPAHYNWTPRGYLSIGGYWDRLLEHRGLLFTPVAFTQPIYREAGFTYTPEVVFNTAALTTNLFVRPGYGHYYFGDYYGPTYTSLGFYPWFRARTNVGAGYDPLFSYYRTYYRQHDAEWFNRLDQRYTYLSAHPEARPPRTYRDEARIVRTGGNRTDVFTSISQNNAVVAAPLREVVNRNAAFSPTGRIASVDNLRLARVSPQEQQDYRQREAKVHEFSQQRVQLEHNRQQGRSALDLKPLISNTPRQPAERVVQRPNLETEPRTINPRAEQPRSERETGPRTINPRAEQPRTGAETGPQTINPRAEGRSPRAPEGQPTNERGPGRTVEPVRPNESIRPNEPVRPTIPGRTVEPPRANVPREPMPRVTTPREIGPRTVTPREVAPREAAPRSVTPTEPMPRQVTPREATPREPMPRETAPRAATPRPAQAAPREVAPRTVTPREPAPREAAPREAAPREPREAARPMPTPKVVEPRQPAPRQPAPREAAPREPQPRDATPREARREAPPKAATPQPAAKPAPKPAPERRDGGKPQQPPRDANPKDPNKDKDKKA